MENPHKGHRKRLREQFIKNGLESMQPHQALELLLFYAIPQADTNVYAHELIDRFGSLCGVFNASYEDLQSVNGIGENSAALIKLVPQIYTMYAASEFDGKELKSMQDMCRMAIAMFYGRAVEETRLICLDDGFRIRLNSKIACGDGSSVTFSARKVVETVMRTSCSKCVLIHNHPHASSMPSNEDIAITENLKRLLKEVGVNLLDHIVVGNDGARTIISGDMRFQRDK